MNGPARRILVTGAGSGIGRALAIEAARRGMLVVLCGRRPEPLAETRAAMPGEGHMVIPCDVLDGASRAHLVTEVAHTWGGIDMLVNNAEVIAFGPLRTMTDEEITAVISTNLIAPICFVRDCLPLLRRGREPQVANMGSLLGSIPYPLFAAYSASKSGLHALSSALRRELAPLGIDVTHVAPRATRTPGADKLMAYARHLEMRFDSPETVARAVLYGLAKRRPVIYPRGLERVFLAAQRIAPGIVDHAIARQLHRAAADGLPID